FASAHALTKLGVQDGSLVTASGMRYRILALDPRARVMSLDVLKTIAHLVYAGATVVGDMPQGTPSLSDNAAQFRELAAMLWGDGATGEHQYGHGRILSGHSIAEVFQTLRIGPDFQHSKPHPDTSVSFVHRQLTDGDLYFLNNRQNHAEYIDARFREVGK